MKILLVKKDETKDKDKSVYWTGGRWIMGMGQGR